MINKLIFCWIVTILFVEKWGIVGREQQMMMSHGWQMAKSEHLLVRNMQLTARNEHQGVIYGQYRILDSFEIIVSFWSISELIWEYLESETSTKHEKRFKMWRMKSLTSRFQLCMANLHSSIEICKIKTVRKIAILRTLS